MSHGAHGEIDEHAGAGGHTGWVTQGREWAGTGGGEGGREEERKGKEESIEGEKKEKKEKKKRDTEGEKKKKRDWACLLCGSNVPLQNSGKVIVKPYFLLKRLNNGGGAYKFTGATP